MTATEKQVRLAARLYEIRDTMRTFYGDAWPGMCRDMEPYIRAQTEQHGYSFIGAAQALVAGETPSTLAVLQIIGAAVEMTEVDE